MVFFALCCQCASTLAVIRRETQSWAWPAFTFAYMTVLAYLGALVTFQAGGQDHRCSHLKRHLKIAGLCGATISGCKDARMSRMQMRSQDARMQGCKDARMQGCAMQGCDEIVLTLHSSMESEPCRQCFSLDWSGSSSRRRWHL